MQLLRNISHTLKNLQIINRTCLKNETADRCSNVTYIWFPLYLYSEELILQWIDDDDDITKLRSNDSPPIVSCVFRPDDVNFIIAEMTHLQDYEM